MNGRVYDPSLGRMLSPDPVTQAPENGQNYNRYTYAYNNPLKYTDPSGYRNKKGKFAAIGGTADYRNSNAIGLGNLGVGIVSQAGQDPGQMNYVTGPNSTLHTVPGPYKGPFIVGNQATLGHAGSGGVVPAGQVGDKSDATGGTPATLVQPTSEQNTPATGYSEDSQMTTNTDGHWQIRDSAAFEAAGLGPSTATNSCSPAGNAGCAFIGTLLGGGDDIYTRVADGALNAGDVVNDATGMLKVIQSGQVRIGWYIATFITRYNNSFDYCELTCGKEVWQKK